MEMLGYLFQQLNFKITYIPGSSGCPGSHIARCEVFQRESLDLMALTQQQQQAGGTP